MVDLSVPCPICHVQLPVVESIGADGSPFFDAETVLNGHLASKHPAYAPNPNAGFIGGQP